MLNNPRIEGVKTMHSIDHIVKNIKMHDGIVFLHIWDETITLNSHLMSELTSKASPKFQHISMTLAQGDDVFDGGIGEV